MSHRPMHFNLVRCLCRVLRLGLLLSALLASTKLTTSGAVQLPIFALSEEQFSHLPPYCKQTTGYFPCVDVDTGETNCLPVAMRCRTHCANDDQLKCPHTKTNCSAGLFQCASRIDQTQQRPICLPDHLLCDGRLHCPLGDDESPQLCQSRSPCPPDRFACRSPGHCLPSNRRCDGPADCRRPGLDDRSDEADCPTVAARATMPHKAAECASEDRFCDGFPDCDDGSDELDCPSAIDFNEVHPETALSKPSATLDTPTSTPGLKQGTAARILVATTDEVSGRPTLTFIDFNSNGGIGKQTTMSLHAFGSVVAIDEVAERVFIFDSPSGHLKSLHWSASSEGLTDVSLGGKFAITDAAYDAHRRLLFYASSTDGSVGVVAVDRGWRSTLRLLDCPRGLLLHPELGHLFVALTCGPSPGIYQLSMDGRELRLLLGSRFVRQPIGFGFDSVKQPQRLYWIEPDSGVFSVQLEGGSDVRKHFSWPSEILKVEKARLIANDKQLYLAAMLDGSAWTLHTLTPTVESNTGVQPTKIDFPGTATVTLISILPEQAAQAGEPALLPQCKCDQICLPAWDSRSETECLCDWRYSSVLLSNSLSVRCVATAAAAAAAEPAAAAAAEPAAAAAETTAPATTSASSTTSIPNSYETERRLGMVVSLLAVLTISALIVCVCLWLCLRWRCCRRSKRQSIELSAADEPENAKLTSVQTFDTMLSVESRTQLVVVREGGPAN